MLLDLRERGVVGGSEGLEVWVRKLFLIQRLRWLWLDLPWWENERQGLCVPLQPPLMQKRRPSGMRIKALKLTLSLMCFAPVLRCQSISQSHFSCHQHERLGDPSRNTEDVRWVQRYFFCTFLRLCDCFFGVDSFAVSGWFYAWKDTSVFFVFFQIPLLYFQQNE